MKSPSLPILIILAILCEITQKFANLSLLIQEKYGKLSFMDFTVTANGETQNHVNFDLDPSLFEGLSNVFIVD